MHGEAVSSSVAFDKYNYCHRVGNALREGHALRQLKNRNLIYSFTRTLQEGDLEKWESNQK